MDFVVGATVAEVGMVVDADADGVVVQMVPESVVGVKVLITLFEIAQRDFVRPVGIEAMTKAVKSVRIINID